MRRGCSGWPGAGSCWQEDVALPGQGLSVPRQVEPAPLPGCGSESTVQCGAGSQGMQHQAVECPPPHHLILWLLGPAARFQSVFRALKSHFQAAPITTNSLLCFIDKPSHFQAVVLLQTKAGSCSAGIGIIRDEHTSSPRWGVNCWCLQGCIITPLVCTLWKSESKFSRSPPALKTLTAQSHLWGPPRDPELVPLLQTLLSPA